MMGTDRYSIAIKDGAEPAMVFAKLFNRNRVAAFCFAFLVTFWSVGVGILIFLGAFFILFAAIFVSMRKRSREDFDNAKTVFGTISASFGWTHSRMVANQKRPLFGSEIERIMMVVIFGFFAGVLALKATHSVFKFGVGQ